MGGSHNHPQSSSQRATGPSSSSSTGNASSSHPPPSSSSSSQTMFNASRKRSTSQQQRYFPSIPSEHQPLLNDYDQYAPPPSSSFPPPRQHRIPLSNQDPMNWNDMPSVEYVTSVKRAQPQRTTKAQPKVVLFPTEDAEIDKYAYQTEEWIQQFQGDTSYTSGNINNTNYYYNGTFGMSDSRPIDTVMETGFRERGRKERRQQQRDSNYNNQRGGSPDTTDSKASSLRRVTAYCIGEAYKLDDLKKMLSKRHGVDPKVYDEVLHAIYDEEQKHRAIALREGVFGGSSVRSLFTMRSDYDESTQFLAGPDVSAASLKQSHIFAFDYGVIVFWGFTEAEELVVINHLNRFCTNPLSSDEIEIEALQFTYSTQTPDLLVSSSSPSRLHNSMSNPNLLSDTHQLRQRNHNSATHKQKQVQFQQPQHQSMNASRNETIEDMGAMERAKIAAAAPFSKSNSATAMDAPLHTQKPDNNENVPNNASASQTGTEATVSNPPQSRIFDDIITLNSANSMIKLTISHGIAQSVKLAYYENLLDAGIEKTKHLPKRLAKYGEVQMNRADVTKIMGELFKLRMAVNLVSNVLDTPEWFYSERNWKPLYDAIRGYLEIPQRVKLVNQRLEVISDLLNMLSDTMNSSQMTWLTWVVIWLIAIAVTIATLEIAMKILLSTDS